jgi:hypothetical protein
MNTVEYVQHWAKLHDVNFVISESIITSYTNIDFKNHRLCLSDRDDKETVSSLLYDLVYGARESTPDTVRF